MRQYVLYDPVSEQYLNESDGFTYSEFNMLGSYHFTGSELNNPTHVRFRSGKYFVPIEYNVDTREMHPNHLNSIKIG